MSYATINDMRKMFEQAIKEEKYHIIITIGNKDGLESFTYGQGISDADVLLQDIDEIKKIIL